MKFWSFKHNIVYVVLSLEFEDVFFYPIVIIIQLKLKLFLIIFKCDGSTCFMLSFSKIRVQQNDQRYNNDPVSLS